MQKWMGDREKCDLCGRDIKDVHFVDGATTRGPWALMCLQCHEDEGVGLGTGKGQLYDEVGNKVKG